MQSKATRRSALAVKATHRFPPTVVQPRRLPIKIARTQLGPASKMRLWPLIAFIAMIAGWAVVAGLVWLAIGLL